MKEQSLTEEAAVLDRKADELVMLLRKGVVGAHHLKTIEQKLLHALDEASLPQKIDAFREVSANGNRIDMLNDFEMLLSQHQLDSTVAKKYVIQERIKTMVLMIIGVIMITLGLAMIIMPAPPYFEMFTVFYFNPNDGVTIMDIISLLIVFTGVYLLLNAVLKKQGIIHH